MNVPIPQVKGFEKLDALLNKKSVKDTDTEEAYTMVRVMQVVGGYEQMLKLPTNVYANVIKGIKEHDRRELEKQMKMLGKKGKR